MNFSGSSIGPTATNDGETVELIVGSTGNHGIYSRSNSNWIIYEEPGGDVNVTAPFHITGNFHLKYQVSYGTKA